MLNTLETTSPFVQTQAVVALHEAASSRYFRLRLHCPEIARRAQPGQFVMLACASDHGGRASETLLPRPLAILDAANEHIELLYFVAGAGTQCLQRTVQQLGASLRIIGPLGEGFKPIPNVDLHLAVGGGSGVAPLVFFFRRFAAQSQGQWHLILAARSADQLARDALIQVPGQLHRATDDGSAGMRGTGVDALAQLLQRFEKPRAGIYAAGPEPMMRAAANLGRQLGLPVRVSLEARMACGVGVCRACVVDGTLAHPKTGLLRRTVCHDGPVFDIDELAGW